MNRIEFKSFKSFEKEEKFVDIIRYEIKRIEIYDENGQLFTILDSNDGDLVEGFIIKARKIAQGGRLRLKYIYY